MVHLLGFSGSALIIVATTMRSVAWLRVFALVGSGAFVVYGLVLPAWPVAVTNVVTTSVHLYHLVHLPNVRARSVAAARSIMRRAGDMRRVSA